MLRSIQAVPAARPSATAADDRGEGDGAAQEGDSGRGKIQTHAAGDRDRFTCECRPGAEKLIDGRRNMLKVLKGGGERRTRRRFPGGAIVIPRELGPSRPNCCGTRSNRNFGNRTAGNLRDSTYEAGIRAYRQGRYQESVELFARVLQGGGDSGETEKARYWTGEALHASGRATEAYNTFERVLSNANSSMDQPALVRMGMILYQ